MDTPEQLIAKAKTLALSLRWQANKSRDVEAADVIDALVALLVSQSPEGRALLDVDLVKALRGVMDTKHSPDGCICAVHEHARAILKAAS